MTVFTARVVDGRIDVPDGVLPDGPVPDGTTVTVVVPDGDEAGFTVTEAQKALLLESIAQADRGDMVDGWAALRRLES